MFDCHWPEIIVLWRRIFGITLSWHVAAQVTALFEALRAKASQQLAEHKFYNTFIR